MTTLNQGIRLVFLFIFLLSANTAHAWTWNPNIALTSLTQNNTSACGNATSPCTQQWTGTANGKNGFWDLAVPNSTSQPKSTYGYVSKVPMSTLLPGYTTQVIVETQNWWGNGNGHITNGENSTNVTQIKNQMADMVSRGIAGQVIDWYGYKDSGGVKHGPDTTADSAAQNILNNIASYQYGSVPYKFAIMIDKGYFDPTKGGCGDTVTCLNNALSYLTKYFNSPYYMKDSGGHPLVYFFVNSYYPNEFNILFGSGISYQNSKFVMYEPSGFSGAPPQTDGEYAWVNPADNLNYINVTGSQGSFWINPDYGFLSSSGYYSKAKSNQSKYIVPSVYKGFDDNLASWSLNRIIDQQCGQVWLNTFNYTGNYGVSGASGVLNYLKGGYLANYVMVATWDDYEEGTEMETGIDNCLSKVAPTVSGNTLTWTDTWGADPMNSKIYGNESSLYKYDIYMANPGGTNVQFLTSCYVGSCSKSLDLTKYGITSGSYVFYVQAVGMPSIRNTLSAVSNTWNYGTSSPTPTPKPSPTPSPSPSPGALTVTITAPVNNQNVTSPTYVIASASGGTGGISSMQIYVDGNIYQTFSGKTSINNPVYLDGGPHKITVKAWDNSGNSVYKDITGLNGSCSNLQGAAIPQADGKTGTTVQIAGGGCACDGVNSVQVFLDDAQIYTGPEFASDVLTTVTTKTGNHTSYVKVWANGGSKCGSVYSSPKITFTVQ